MENAIPEIIVYAAAGKARVRVPVSGMALPEELSWCGYVSIEAEHYAYKTDTKAGEFRILPDYGRTLSAVKAFPQDAVFTAKQAPSVTYRFKVPAAGRYTVRLYTNPSNPAGRIPELFAGIAANGEHMRKINMVADGFRVGDGSFVWAKGVLDNNRCTETTLTLNAGDNTLTVYALGPGLVLTKVVVYPEGQEPMKSYLGPGETPI